MRSLVHSGTEENLGGTGNQKIVKWHLDFYIMEKDKVFKLQRTRVDPGQNSRTDVPRLGIHN